MSIALALALMLDQTAGDDPRLISLRWHDNRVVRLVGRAGIEATISLDPDEHIENVAIGDANAWQVTPNRRANMLFVKPLAAHAHTNLTVVTERRTYFFDLVASPGARPIYGLRMTYPEPPAKPAPPPPPAPLTGEEAALVHGAATPPPVDPASLDTGFAVRGARELAPARVFADGHDTYIAWPKGVTLPAVLGRNDRGVEGPINYAMRDDMIVIAGVPDTIVLRSGKAVATIEHQHPAKPTAVP
jgi:type IV secretion system protein VirB9